MIDIAAIRKRRDDICKAIRAVHGAKRVTPQVKIALRTRGMLSYGYDDDHVSIFGRATDDQILRIAEVLGLTDAS